MVVNEQGEDRSLLRGKLPQRLQHQVLVTGADVGGCGVWAEVILGLLA